MIRPSKPFAALTLLAGLLLLGGSLFPHVALAQDEEEAESEPLFQVQRIEVKFYGGIAGGEKYLQLPEITDPQTNDTAEDKILDFEGNSAYDEGLHQAPEKELKSGKLFGVESTFYLSEAFGFFLSGSVTSADAVLTGRRDLRTPREEFDRTNVRTFSGRFGVTYQIGNPRKLPIRPYVSLAFGGLLNRFEKADDITALSFDLGGGASVDLSDAFRARLGVGLLFYSWKTDEVALDKTMIIPQATVGIVWRHDVPGVGSGS
jgi:hypothetical protein